MIPKNKKILWTTRKKTFILALIYAMFSMVALSANGTIPTIEDVGKLLSDTNIVFTTLAKVYLSLNPANVVTSVFFIGLVLFFYNGIEKKKNDRILILISCMFSIFMVLGFSYDKYDNWDYIFANSFQVIFSVIQIIGWGYLFYFLLEYLSRLINDKNIVDSINLNFTIIIGIFVVSWLPFIFTYLPASVDYDAFAMLKNYSGEGTWTTHHPVIPAILLGIIMDFGVRLGSVNLGAFICVIIQMISMIAVFCYLIEFMLELKVRSVFCTITIVYFALCPVWPAYAQVVIKDTLNMVFCLMYTILYLKILKQPIWLSSWQHKTIILCTALLVCMFRNTGVYLVVLSAIPLGIHWYIQKIPYVKGFGRTIFTCICIITLLNHCVIPMMGILPGSKGEILSIPFQQTARYIKEYPNDVTEEEKEVINNILKYDILAKNYNPNLSDPVKGTMHSQKQSNIVAYFKVWKNMFLKHPDSYIQAMLNNTYGYFYPDSISKSRGTGLKFYISPKTAEHPVNTGTYDIQYMHNSNLRNAISFYANSFFQQIPILGLSYNTGVYTWILILCITFLIKYKKYYALLGTLPSVLTILFCIVSPVNGYVRYMLPAMAATPLMIAWTLYAIRESEGNKLTKNKKRIHNS